MVKRVLTRKELISLGLSETKVEHALELQKQKKERRFKYIVLLTPAEAERAAKQIGKKFIRATEYKTQKDR